MLGRKASVKVIETELRKNQVVNIRTTEFYQGRTTRWGIAWSFSTDGLQELVKEKTETITKRLKSTVTNFRLTNCDVKKVFQSTVQLLKQLAIPCKIDNVAMQIKVHFILHITE